VVTKAIPLYDLEMSSDKQPAEVMDEVEPDIQWPLGPNERLQMISEHELKRLSQGYAFPFCSCAIPCSYGLLSPWRKWKGQLEIAPRPGQDRPPLPEWSL